MLQIKTVMNSFPSEFDKEVNEALADGWALVRRYYTSDLYHTAELEREIITEDERNCDNCKHRWRPYGDNLDTGARHIS